MGDTAGLRREYEAGRISADSYIAAGGDPDVVRRVEERRAREAAEKKAADAKSTKRWTLGCLAIPVLIIGGCMAMGLGGGGQESAREARWSAESICEKSVRQQMKDPDSAQFSGVTVEVIGDQPPTYTYQVTGTVRGTNSFGGTAVHAFSCSASYDVDSGEATGRASLN